MSEERQRFVPLLNGYSHVKRMLAGWLGLTTLAAAVALAVAPQAALADTATIRQFNVPTKGGNSPADITTGPDGNLWFTEFDNHKVGRITPTGMITEFVTTGSPSSITVGGDGNLWFLEGGQGMIGRISTTGMVKEFPVAGLFNPQGEFEGITLGPDGNVWFADSVVGTIGFITPAGAVSETTVAAGPFDIVTGPDGNLWFTDTQNNGAIGRISPTFTNFTEFSLPAPASGLTGRRPTGITVGPDGNIWYTDDGANVVGNVSTTGVVTEFPVPYSGARPNAIVSGPDGNLWFTEEFGDRVAKITAAGVISQILLPKKTFPNGITVGPDSKIWFTEPDYLGNGTANGDKIATFDPFTVKPPPPPCLIATNSIVLTHDVGPCPGDGIVVAANNITVDLGGHHVFASPGRRVGDFAGIRLPGRSQVTIKNGEVSGFDAGLVLDHGSSNTIARLDVHDNLGPFNPATALGDGIDLFHSAHNNIVNNVVARNGPFNGISVLGLGSDYNLLQGNNVHDNTDETLGSAAPGGGTGILIDSFLESEAVGRGSSLTGNDVIANKVSNNVASGISVISDTNARVMNNTVNHSGFRPNGRPGNFPANGIGIQRNAKATSMTQDIVTGNIVTNSFADGIQLPNTDGNQVNHNRVTGGSRFGIATYQGNLNTINDNLAEGSAIFDLYDGNTDSLGLPPCASNNWFENTYTTANPICTTVGGHQVQGPPATSATHAAVQPAPDPAQSGALPRTFQVLRQGLISAPASGEF